MSSSSAEYKKALKTLEGEKRAALKKAKALKGAKGKEAVTQIEQDFERQFQALQINFGGGGADGGPGGPGGGDETTSVAMTTTAEGGNHDILDVDEEERQKKLLKIQRKKEKQRQKEREKKKEQEEYEALAKAGPNYKQIEWEQIQMHLQRLHFKVQKVTADGHCLYRAVGGQIGKEYTEIRSLCADTLAAHPDEFSPFCEYPEDDDDTTGSTNMDKYEQYVSKVRLSSEWGGHLELRALAMALARSILVYQSTSPDPLEIVGGEPTPANEPIRLSYHKHYYALGEHYNQVVPMSGGGGNDDDDDDGDEDE